MGVVPAFTPRRDKRPRDRWAFQPQEGFVGVLDDRELPETSAEHMQYATRLRGTLNGFDVSLSYFDGYDTTPVLRQTMVSAGFFQVQKLTPVYTRLKAVGADVSTTWRKFEFHAEGAAKFVESHGRDDRFQWVAGLNYTFDELPVKWLERIETILEYSQENILDKRRHSEYGAAIGFFSLAFRNALTGRLRFKFSEETQVALSGTANFESAEPGYYLQLKLTRKLTDAVHVEGGFDVIDGPTHTVWGQWRRNDRAFVLLKYFF